MSDDTKRLFFAFEVSAPWPELLPKGRLLQKEERHLTVAFLGQTDYAKLHSLLPRIPLPPFKIGLVGEFDNVLLLPKRHPRVIAWHVHWLDREGLVSTYANALIDWLRNNGLTIDSHSEFLPHVTLCRAPFDGQSWRKTFASLPMMINKLHLYESLGQLRYKALWTHQLHAPFEEIEHTADIAFKICGENIPQILLNAMAALAFKCPEILKFHDARVITNSIDDVIMELNRLISRVDSASGCSFKAVSFHGEIEHNQDHTLTWEMIIDV